jgi:hypothetical protein
MSKEILNTISPRQMKAMAALIYCWELIRLSRNLESTQGEEEGRRHNGWANKEACAKVYIANSCKVNI